MSAYQVHDGVARLLIAFSIKLKAVIICVCSATVVLVCGMVLVELRVKAVFPRALVCKDIK